MMDFLNIPEKCRFSTPKIIKIDHISKGQESQCQTISSIEWLGTISPVSANVTSYTDEYQSYNEIQILHICVSDTNDLYHAVKAIYRAILYPTLLVVQYKDKYLLSACAYQIGKMDSDKNILRNPAFSHWIHNDFKSDEAKLFIQKVNLQLNADGSLREIYFGILHAIQMLPLGGIGNRQYLIRIVKWLIGSCSSDFFEAAFQTCTPYKKYAPQNTSKKSKYAADHQGQAYTYSYDTEDVWYSLMMEETTKRAIQGRRYSNLEEIIYRMDY